jgi:hypothetical protein
MHDIPTDLFIEKRVEYFRRRTLVQRYRLLIIVMQFGTNRETHTLWNALQSRPRMHRKIKVP